MGAKVCSVRRHDITRVILIHENVFPHTSMPVPRFFLHITYIVRVMAENMCQQACRRIPAPLAGLAIEAGFTPKPI